MRAPGPGDAPGGGSRGATRLRVGIVAACRFPAPRGSQVLIDEMARAFAREGVETHLFAPLARPVRRPYRAHPLGGRHGIAPPADPLAFPRFARLAIGAGGASRLAGLLARERIDVVHAHNWEGLVLALVARRACGVPVVFHVHGVLADELPHYVPPGAGEAARRLGAWCDARLPRLADAVVVLSEDVQTYLVANGVHPGRIRVSAPGLAQGAQPARERRSRPAAIFTGNLDRYQNIDLLLDAWELAVPRVGHAELVVATHGNAGTLERAIARRGLRSVRTVGRASGREVAAELAAATVGVSPRTSWSGFPMKTLNYMAAGIPTIALAGSAKGIRDGCTGWIVREPTAGALASALCEALGEPSEAMRRGRAARELLATEHSWEVLAPRLLELSEGVAGLAPG